VPVYNEARRAAQTLEQITAYLARQSYTSEVIVVDDGSTDRSAEIIESFRATHPNVTLIRNDHRGKGFAVRTGMLAGRGRIVLFMDADLATPVEETGRLLPWFEQGYDVVIGSRAIAGGRDVTRRFHRRVMGVVYNWLVRLLTVHGIRDTQCGFKAFRREIIHELFARSRLYGPDSPTIQGAMVTGFDVELLFLAQKAGYKIKEVPVDWHHRGETSVHPLKDPWRCFCDMLRVWWNNLRGLYDPRT
jgi:glycosyltransferase involved in cell wall biosynthesis